MSWPVWALSTSGLLGLGIWAAGGAERAFESEDDGRIVIDEVVGQLIALGPLVGSAPTFFGLVTAFVAFRLFDVWKPLPVRWAERSFEGGKGVMLDDVVAGVMAAAVVLGARSAGWLG